MKFSPACAASLLIIAAVILRLVFVACTGLGIDESYMVASAGHFSSSYFDHPPISWWLELASRRLFHSDAPWVVRLPFVLASALSSWLLFALTRRLYGAPAGFWAVAAYSISPVFSLAFGAWVLPDGPLDASLLAFAYCLTRALGIPARPEPRWWLAAGLFAGLAMLSKYNAVLVLAGAAAVLLTDKSARAQLLGWRPWAGAALAVLLFSPVIYWNFAHHWASFHYQSGRATGLRLHPWAPLRIWAGEALFLLPWLWLPLVVLLAAALRRGPAERRGWLLAMLGVLPVVVFALIGLWSSTRILYHWATPGYLLLLPLLGNWAACWRPAIRNVTATASGALLATSALALVIATQSGFLARTSALFPPGRSPFLQALDWTSLRAQVPRGSIIATLRWYDAGKIGYALGNAVTVTVFGPEPHEFGISTPPASLIGRNILLVAMPGDISAITRQYQPDFKSLKPAPAISVISHGHVLLVMPVLLGTALLKAP